MKYLIIILLTLGCFKSKSKPDASVLIDTFLYNNKYLFIIQDSVSYVSETLDENNLECILKKFKDDLDRPNGEDKALKYNLLNINNLKDVVKKVFGDVVQLKSTAYRYKKHDIIIIHNHLGGFSVYSKESEKEGIIKELEDLKSELEKEQNEKDECLWDRFAFKDEAAYKFYAEKIEKLFKD